MMQNECISLISAVFNALSWLYWGIFGSREKRYGSQKRQFALPKVRYTKRIYKTFVQANCIWKFFQRHFIASKLDAGCSGYLDKTYKILVDILDLKAGFPLANFFIRSDFFRSKKIKSRSVSYFFYFEKVANQWEFSKKSIRFEAK